MFASRFVCCASCNKRGDQIKKKDLLTVVNSDSFYLASLNRSTKKKSSRDLILGNLFL